MEITFLTKEQVENLKTLKKRGIKAPITDFSILLGAFNNDGYGTYWTSSKGDFPFAITTVSNGLAFAYASDKIIGARPVIKVPESYKVASSLIKVAPDGIKELEYGFYPKQVPSRGIQRKLERNFRSIFRNNLKATFDTITIDNNIYGISSSDDTFSNDTINVYEFEGKRYVRLIAKYSYDSKLKIQRISTGQKYKKNNGIWIEVMPVKWLLDEEANILVSESILFSGIEFSSKKSYDGNFNDTHIKKFMDNFFIKDLTRNETSKLFVPKEEVVKVYKFKTSEPIIQKSQVLKRERRK